MGVGGFRIVARLIRQISAVISLPLLEGCTWVQWCMWAGVAIGVASRGCYHLGFMFILLGLGLTFTGFCGLLLSGFFASRGLKIRGGVRGVLCVVLCCVVMCVCARACVCVCV